MEQYHFSHHTHLANNPEEYISPHLWEIDELLAENFIEFVITKVFRFKHYLTTSITSFFINGLVRDKALSNAEFALI